MRTIYKYPLEITDQQAIEVPAHAEFLTAQMQRTSILEDRKLYVWAIVDTANLKEIEHFFIVGTGNPMPEKPKLLQHLGTVQEEDGWLIWHVFRAIK